MNHQEILKQWLWGKYQQSPAFWYQCVAFAVLYNKLRYNAAVWRFGWVWAYTWWLNTNHTFWPEFDRIPNWPTLVPQQGDTIIFKNMWRERLKNGTIVVHWHIAIVDSADLNTVTVVEQNWAHWLWKWTDWDEIRLHRYDYSNVCWRYHYRAQPAPVIVQTEIDASTIWQSLISDNIWNGQLGEWITERLILLLEKLYAKSKNQ